MMNSSGLFPHFLGILSKAPMGQGDTPGDAPHPFRPTAPVLKRRQPSQDSSTGTPTSMKNASDWNSGGYEQHKAGDSQREKLFPPGTPVNNPRVNSQPIQGARPAPRPVTSGRKLFQE